MFLEGGVEGLISFPKIPGLHHWYIPHRVEALKKKIIFDFHAP